MNLRPIDQNQRILVIDDNGAIHDDFRKILGAPDVLEADLQEAEAKIFGTKQIVPFEIDAALQGEEGLKMVERALAEGRPYAMAFVDVRMPPGWDGIETTKRIWEVCPDLQIVICTAYADCSWSEMQEQINPRDRLLILKKPFDTVEILQLAKTLTTKWRLLQESKTRLTIVEQTVTERTRELEASRLAALNMMQDAVRSREKAEQAYKDLQREVEERKKIEAQILRAQRLESLGTLAAGVAHDLNNSLAPILMVTELLRMQYPDDTKMIDTVQTSATRGADMVKQLLTFAKGAGGERLLVQPRHLLNEMGKLIKSSFPKNIEVRTSCAKNLHLVLGDATQLHQVLLNLCINARDAMPSGGTLSLSLENMEIDSTYAGSLPAAKPGHYAMLRVEDTGTGIPPEIRDRIFDPFFTTKGPDKGTGLGLCTVIGIVKSHGGFVQVDSVPGRGSTFTVYLPADTSGASTEASAPPEAGPFGHGELVLVVDDEASIRDITVQTLRMSGYEVVSAPDGAAAMAMFSEHRDRIKLIITDLMMPIVDGAALVRAVRSLSPELKIIVTSGLREEAPRGDSAELGGQVFLQKPYSVPKLLGTIDETLHPR